MTYVLALACLAATATSAQVDQSNTVAPNFGITILGLGPIGEVFTPQLAGINFVTLALSEVSGNAATVAVSLRAGSIQGQLLGTTNPVFLPGRFGGSSFRLVNFFFNETVPLQPGQDYVLQIVATGFTNVFAWGNQLPGGTGGRAIVGGPYPCCNFYYVEGITVPDEASTGLLLMVALSAAALLARSTGARSKLWFKAQRVSGASSSG